jgi:hypothetical protein
VSTAKAIAQKSMLGAGITQLPRLLPNDTEIATLGKVRTIGQDELNVMFRNRLPLGHQAVPLRLGSNRGPAMTYTELSSTLLSRSNRAKTLTNHVHDDYPIVRLQKDVFLARSPWSLPTWVPSMYYRDSPLKGSFLDADRGSLLGAD